MSTIALTLTQTELDLLIEASAFMKNELRERANNPLLPSYRAEEFRSRAGSYEVIEKSLQSRELELVSLKT